MSQFQNHKVDVVRKKKKASTQSVQWYFGGILDCHCESLLNDNCLCNATSLAGAQTEAQEAVIRKHFSTVRVMGYRLPGVVVGSSCLEIFKNPSGCGPG